MRMSGGRCSDRPRSSGGGVSRSGSPPARLRDDPEPGGGLADAREGPLRLRSTSTASAFSGETYRTRSRWRRCAGDGADPGRSSAQRKAARVLPDPSAPRPVRRVPSSRTAAQAPLLCREWAQLKAALEPRSSGGGEQLHGGGHVPILTRRTDKTRPGGSHNRPMRLSEFWKRMHEYFARYGPGYAEMFARDHVMAELDNRTVDQALAAGMPAKDVWRAVCASQDVPARLR